MKRKEFLKSIGLLALAPVALVKALGKKKEKEREWEGAYYHTQNGKVGTYDYKVVMLDKDGKPIGEDFEFWAYPPEAVSELSKALSIGYGENPKGDGYVVESIKIPSRLTTKELKENAKIWHGLK